MKKFYFLLLSLTALITGAQAQDPQFTQFYAAPLYLNPAFAGAVSDSRAHFNNRYQWVKLKRAFTTYSVSLDRNFPKFRSGIGIIANHSSEGSGLLKNTELGLQYSFDIPLSDKWHVRPGLQASYVNRSIDFQRLLFGDQIDRDGIASSAEFLSDVNNIQYADYSSGAVAYNERIWIGGAVHHINRPNNSLTFSTARLPMRISAHGGIRFDLIKRDPNGGTYRKEIENALIPSFNFQMQGEFTETALGCYFHHDPVIFGVWYRGLPWLKSTPNNSLNHDAISLLVGAKRDNFTVGYSYDITISDLTLNGTAGSHEISIGILFLTKDPNKKKKVNKRDLVLPCPVM